MVRLELMDLSLGRASNVGKELARCGGCHPALPLVLACQSTSRAVYWDFPLINSQFCFSTSQLVI